MIQEIISRRLILEGQQENNVPFTYFLGETVKLGTSANSFFTLKGLKKEPVVMKLATFTPYIVSKHKIVVFIVDGEGADGNKPEHIMGGSIEVIPTKKASLIFEGLGERGALVSLAMERPLKITAVIYG